MSTLEAIALAIAGGITDGRLKPGDRATPTVMRTHQIWESPRSLAGTRGGDNRIVEARWGRNVSEVPTHLVVRSVASH